MTPPPPLQALAAELERRLAQADEPALWREAQALTDAALQRAGQCRRDGRRADGDPEFDWLRERSLQLWHAWGACATSGGDGYARSQDIRQARDALARAAGGGHD